MAQQASQQSSRQLDMTLAQQSSDEPRFLVSDLLAYLESYLTTEQIREVYRAYLFSADAHINQKRMSGEPYIYHPIAVAYILAGMRLDYKCLMAAIMHDVIEDTPTAKGEIAEIFDAEVAELVDAVTKLTHLDFSSREEAVAASFRKMILAMTRDIRVILIKLADRLHNMRTLGVMRPDKARRISRETLEIYAPIAKRLGINRICEELEELAFIAHWPWRYAILKRVVEQNHGRQRKVISAIINTLRRQLVQTDIPAEVFGRQKNLYSIYRKISHRKVRFADIADVLAFRIIVQSVDDCYRVLGAVHHLYKPKPGNFKDYIAIPKSNGYQSLHTIVVGPHGAPVEIQIRTEAMHHFAEEGVATHWEYKHGEEGGRIDGPSIEWLKNLTDLQEDSASSIEFLEHVKVDLFPDEVYVFTPKGKIMVLPRGATVLDFAYAVHTDVGNHCVAARVDKRMAPLRTLLRNGMTIEIHASPNVHPNPKWLEFVATSKARANIRNFLKRLQKREAVNLGAQLLSGELQRFNTTLQSLEQDDIGDKLKTLGYDNLDALLSDIGLGNRPVRFVARQLLGEEVLLNQGLQQPQRSSRQQVAITGTEGMVVKYANCCRPIPGDPIVGAFNPGKGVVIHHSSCRNLSNDRSYNDNWIDVQWESDVKGDFLVKLRMEVKNQPGVLAETAAVIAECGANIDGVVAHDNDGNYAMQEFLLSVRDRSHLARIIRSLRKLPVVIKVMRVIA